MSRYIIALVTLLLSACSWVAGTPPEQAVRVLGAADVGQCRLVGHATVALVDKLDTLRSDPAQVQQALNLLARRSAVTLGGDAVVPSGAVAAGRQAFDIYDCSAR